MILLGSHRVIRALLEAFLLLGLAALSLVRAADPSLRPPNVVLIFCDDLGFGDLSCYGNRQIKTPNLDRMAREGMRFTRAYVPQAVCSASRAALLTGCYPNRVGILGALGPNSKIGIHDDEITLAELFKSRGYATAIYGKWHLGHHPQFLPTRHGFDDYFGLPYSNDMWPRHPTAAPGTYPDLPLLEGEKTIQLDPDQRTLTRSYTERAVQFIERNKARSFFLYVPHSMPHVPLFVSPSFQGKSRAGLFGDVLLEIDWSVGEILKALRKHRIDRHTLVLFTSDNGPWLSYGNHAGSAGPFREGKGTTFEGGVRVPFLARWPGKIPAGRTCDEAVTTMDLWPTFARFIGAELPRDRILDGKDIGPLLMAKPGAKSPHENFYYYWGRELQAVRQGKWKLHLPHHFARLDAPGGGGKPGRYVSTPMEWALYDLESDVAEKVNLLDQFPDEVARLKQLAEQARQDLGDSATKSEGKNVRPAGRLIE
ncbi:MAG: sulfatase [Verrucomicrobiota bacterium]